MRKSILSISMCAVVLLAGSVSADTFGTGVNEFTIDFVDISGDTNPASGYGIVNNDYRMGTYEITNEQWNKFTNIYGTPTGSELDAVRGGNAYDESAYYTGTNVPTNRSSWYEGAQFVNWLNTSNGHAAAYKFTGDQGTSNYTFDVWSAAEAAGGTNLFRHKDAYYFLPTEDEWVKAAYWNGTSLQTYATSDDSLPIEDVDTNSDWEDGAQPWDVGSGSEELNGTFDMMGNAFEWMESPWNYGDYVSGSRRGLRGGSCIHPAYNFTSPNRDYHYDPVIEVHVLGFRVASVPEPCSLVLLSLGGLILHRRKS